jgi:cellulose synthase/poly-beta-1,6-N-acetylglucosamine synthase-like glycosyltransferase
MMTEPSTLNGAQLRRIQGPVPGRDPLVDRYVATRRATCAIRVFSWWWILFSLIVIPVWAWGAGHLLQLPPWLDDSWLGRGNRLSPPTWLHLRPWLQAVHGHICHATNLWLGALAGATVMSVAGRFVKPGGVPATQEPWWVVVPLLLIHLTFVDPKVAISLLTFGICLIYLFSIGFRLTSLLCAGRRPLAGVTTVLVLGVVTAAWLHRNHGLRPWLIIGIGLPAVWAAMLLLRQLFPRRVFTGRIGEREPDEWPVYTVLVPLYREVDVAAKILRHLESLDYPRDRLDVKLLLEADDPATLAAIAAAGVPDWMEVIVVPDAQPKTKPRACNHGLESARGELLVIYDAEDRPEPDQLRRAALAFRRTAPRVACLQAELAYHNHDQNLLTRWFALEYNVWFRRYLPGLTALGGPIPLGGTSNHFRTAVLRELDGWDPFNVTEDCDLGIRLHAAGYRTETFDSITWEEANSRIGNWLRQRSRWLKGYLITHIVWCRRPLWLLGRLGPAGFLRFLYSIFGIAGLALINLVLWTVMAIWGTLAVIDLQHGFTLRELIHSSIDSGLIRDGRRSWPLLYWGEGLHPFWSNLSVAFFTASVALLLANVLFALINTVFGRRPGQRGLVLAGLISPCYWVLISLGAWKGLLQMLFRPHYWEKTVHNLDATYLARRRPPAPPTGG